jgi:NAD+ synthase (glutamine-hydrolysing)
MKFGFFKTAAATCHIRVGDCSYNRNGILSAIAEAHSKGTELLVMPELCITGYTCADLFNQSALLNDALKALAYIKEASSQINIIITVGLPLEYNSKLYNCAAVIYKGNILGIVPKTFLPNYNEFYEKRWFTPAPKETSYINILGESVPFGTKLLFKARDYEHFVLACEICEDVWAPIPPSCNHALAGATVIANLSAGNEITGKAAYRKSLVQNQSARLISGYIYACAGEGESTTDVVFSGHNLICENGIVLSESTLFENGIVYADIDIDRLVSEKRKNTTFTTDSDGYTTVEFDFKPNNAEVNRYVDPHPFVPSNNFEREDRCREIMDIQALGLKKRLTHIGAKTAVIGISGGLDSTLALIIAARAFELADLDKKGIITVTMPCFGTTERTHSNAITLCKALGTTFKEVKIAPAVMQHFSDIGHDPELHDLTYENSQARERTQVLMDLAGKHKGIVIGTGDLSELALGWATYNGDHMSMYGVNCSIPKTLVKYLIKYTADYTDNDILREVLLDVLDTPVSPELLPPDENGNIAQITEDVVGPYELHDFFLYNMMRQAFPPEKIYFLAKLAFKDKYDNAVILKWLRNFYWRFFSQQFKRSCIPDGPKVGSVSLSPRGDWRMPSDASVAEFIKRIESLE